MAEQTGWTKGPWKAEGVTEGWQPINTAPTGGQRVLVYVAPYGPFTAHFDKRWHVSGLDWSVATPSHWKELPKPPGSPLFPETFCNSCGRAFGPGDHGFSHCERHTHLTPATETREAAE